MKRKSSPLVRTCFLPLTLLSINRFYITSGSLLFRTLSATYSSVFLHIYRYYLIESTFNFINCEKSAQMNLFIYFLLLFEYVLIENKAISNIRLFSLQHQQKLIQRFGRNFWHDEKITVATQLQLVSMMQ